MQTPTPTASNIPLRRALAIALLTFLALPTLAADALAQRADRAIVLPFEGWRADATRTAVIEALSAQIELVSEDAAVAEGTEMGVAVETPAGMRQVIASLGIDLVLSGSIEGRGRRATVTLIMLDPEGNELAQRPGPSPRRRADRNAIGAAAVELLEEAQQVLEMQAPEPEPEAEPEPEDPAFEPEPEPQGGLPQHFLSGSAGLRIRNASTRVSRALAMGERIHLFEADFYPEIALALSARPWAREDSLLKGIYFGLEGGFSVGIRYLNSTGNERAMDSLRFRAEVGYAYQILPELLEVMGVVGFGMDGMILESPDQMSSTLFSHLRPALVGRLRAYERWVMVEAGVGGRIGLDGGDLAAAFGPGLVFGGFDLFVGIAGEYPVDPSLALTYALRVGYVHHALSFSGNAGTLGNGIGGTDETAEINVMLGAAFDP